MEKVLDASVMSVHHRFNAVLPVVESQAVREEEQGKGQAEKDFRKKLDGVLASYGNKEVLKDVSIRVVEESGGDLQVEVKKHDGEHLATIKAEEFIKSMTSAMQSGQLVDHLC